MIETGYFAKIKDYPETDWLVCVSRKYPWFVKRGVMSHEMILAPSRELLKNWKDGSMTWEEYEEIYRKELNEREFAKKTIAYLGLKHAQGETVRLMCWEKESPCHRFIIESIILEVEQL